MRKIIEALKVGVLALAGFSAIRNLNFVRAIGIILAMVAVFAVGMQFAGSEKYSWVSKTMIVVGIIMCALMLIANIYDFFSDHGEMGGRTGIMLKDLDAIPEEDPTRPKKPKIRRHGDTVPDWKVREKIATAEAILTFMTLNDDTFDRKKLTKRIQVTAADVWAAIDADELGPVEPRLTKAGLRSARAAGERLARDPDRCTCDTVTVDVVRFLIVEAPADVEAYRVTALVHLQLLDKAKNELAIIQQFWTFLRDGRTWKVEQINPSEEADDVCSLQSLLSASLWQEFADNHARNLVVHVVSE